MTRRWGYRDELPSALQVLRDAQLDLWTRRQALFTGYTRGEIDGRVRAGRWIIVLPGVLALLGTPLDHAHLLLAACLSRRTTVASHESAAWLWDLLEEPPPVPTVSVSRHASHGAVGMIRVRRVSDLPAASISRYRCTPCTNPLRTLVDLAGVVDGDTLDGAVDRGLQRKLVTVPGLEAEIARLRRRGRRGVGVLERALGRRGMINVPGPSVLESKLLRLLHRAGVVPSGVEVTFEGDEGGYRLDTMLAPGVAAEVDGFAFHSQAEDRAHDLHRHNDLTRHGLWVIRFTWDDVVRRPDRVIADIHETLAARERLHAPTPPG